MATYSPYFDNTRWTPKASEGTWVPGGPHWLVNPGNWYVTLDELGTWVENFRPEYCRFTWSGTFTGFWWEDSDGNYFSYGTTSGVEFAMDFSNDFDIKWIYGVGTNNADYISNIEFSDDTKIWVGAADLALTGAGAPTISIPSNSADLVLSAAGAPTITIPSNSANLVLSGTGGTPSEYILSNPQTLYYFKLTGGPDGVADVTIPMSSFQCNARFNDPARRFQSASYLDVVVPDALTWAAAIAARTSGQLVIQMAYKQGGAVVMTQEVLRTDYGVPKYDERLNTYTLSGIRMFSPGNSTYAMENVTEKKTSDGKLPWTLKEPHVYLMPGDTATYDGDSITVESIVWSVVAQGKKVITSYKVNE